MESLLVVVWLTVKGISSLNEVMPLVVKFRRLKTEFPTAFWVLQAGRYGNHLFGRKAVVAFGFSEKTVSLCDCFQEE
jgi:hypothetical protein